MFRRLIFAALILIPLTPSLSSACSCMSSNAPCNQTWKSGEVIFLGRVISKSPAETPAREKAPYDIHRQLAFRFSVTESFRGTAIPGQEVVIYTGTGEGGGDCGYPFAVGASYLVYAYASKDELTTDTCTPTSPDVMLAGVVGQLRALRDRRRVADLFGTIGAEAKGAGYAYPVGTKPVAGIRVRVIGSRSYKRSTTTDREGVYSFRSLPSDTYQVEVDLPAGMSTWQRNRGQTITVPIGPEGSTGCRTDLFAHPDGQISGRVVDATGRGVAGSVMIQPADPGSSPTVREGSLPEAPRPRGGLPGYTTEDGNFTLWPLPPGRYRLQFRPKIGSSASFRVPPVLSDIIELSLGQHIENFRFKVSPIRKTPP